MKRFIVFTMFVMFSFLNAGTLLAAEWSDGSDGAIYYKGGKVGIGTGNPQTGLAIQAPGPHQLRLGNHLTEHTGLGYDSAKNIFSIKFGDVEDAESEFSINYAEPKFRFTSGDMRVSDEKPGETVELGTWNTTTDNPDSHAMMYTRTEEGGGDPAFILGIQGRTNWFFTGDRSDGAKLKIGQTPHLEVDTGTTYMTIAKDTGYVGIGTTEPTEILEVNGNIKADGLKNIGAITVQEGELGRELAARTVGDTVWRYRYIPYSEGALAFHATKDDWVSHTTMLKFENDTEVGFPHCNVRIGQVNKDAKLLVSGSVGIGTTDPQSELAVNGTITAKEIIVSTEGWADYVFDDDYKLMPLDELERSIRKDGHLPDIPSAEDVRKNGVSVGEMQAKLLQKIEELTLHVIEQGKEMRQLKAENGMLKGELASLRKGVLSSE